MSSPISRDLRPTSRPAPARRGAAGRRSALGVYERLFTEPWPVAGSALAVGTLSVFLFALDHPWTASDGARNWGGWLLAALELGDGRAPVSPLVYLGSLLNLGILLGACASALLARQFVVRVGPAGELLKGAIGGLLMGVGAVVGFGCNIGGFFSAVAALSLSGFAMMVGLAVGAYLGLRYVVWESRRAIALPVRPGLRFLEARGAGLGWQPIAGALILVGLLLAGVWYGRIDYAPQAGFLLIGVTLGVLFQRSRLCLVRAFREPFLTGDAEHTRALALALAVSTVGCSILKFGNLRDPADWVFPGFWAGGVLGGLLFGFGMVLAGGCGVGALWRAGEGHVKLWIALAMFAVSAAGTSRVLGALGVLERLGVAVFLPSRLGWTGALLLVGAVLVAWSLLATWNERSGVVSLR